MDEARLEHRGRDEIAAWVIMGVLVGAVAGMMTSLKTSGLGKVGRLLLGLGGALIGGLVVQSAQINFGWGPVMIRYEELLFSFLGAIALIVVGRYIRFRAQKTPADKECRPPICALMLIERIGTGERQAGRAVLRK